MPRARLSEEEKVKRRTEAQAKYRQAHKEQLREQRQAQKTRYRARSREAILERNLEKIRQDRELLKAAAMTGNMSLSAAHAACSWLPVLRLGTDFGGLEVPALALRHLKVPFRHVFTSENCAAVRRLGATHSKAELVYVDARESPARDRPEVDVYVAGPPCQDFSVAGQRAGLSGARGKLFEVCLQFVRVRRAPGVVHHRERERAGSAERR